MILQGATQISSVRSLGLQEITVASQDRDEALSEATTAESELYAKEFESRQLQAQAAQGKVCHRIEDTAYHK